MNSWPVRSARFIRLSVTSAHVGGGGGGLALGLVRGAVGDRGSTAEPATSSGVDVAVPLHAAHSNASTTTVTRHNTSVHPQRGPHELELEQQEVLGDHLLRRHVRHTGQRQELK
jgi:hypothetical protein